MIQLQPCYNLYLFQKSLLIALAELFELTTYLSYLVQAQTFKVVFY